MCGQVSRKYRKDLRNHLAVVITPCSVSIAGKRAEGRVDPRVVKKVSVRNRSAEAFCVTNVSGVFA